MEFLLLLAVIVIILLLVIVNRKSRSGITEEVAHQLFELTREIRELRKQVDQLSLPPNSVSQTKATETVKHPETSAPAAIKAEPVSTSGSIAETTRLETTATPGIPEPSKFFPPPFPANIPAPKGNWWQQWLRKNPDMEKFIGENLINKIGIAVLVLGIGFFVKYAIDKDWIHESGRVLIGMLCGSLLIAIAHRLRNSYRSFSSVLVGGGLSVFYFTIAFAFHQYHLLNQVLAFALMVIITAFAAVLSLLYDRMELAILATIGGFITPFLVSTGQNNYISLFTYLSILNAGLLIISYYKKWPPLNVIAFSFTVFIYGGWLISEQHSTKPVPYKNALWFASLFYLQFAGMQVVYNLRKKKAFSKLDFSLLLLINALFYAAGMQLLSYWNQGEGKGLFTILLAFLNILPAWYFFRKKADKNFVYLLIGLALTFISLAIPVQLEGHYITLFWSAEAVLLLWFYQQSGITLARLTSVIICLLSIISLLLDWDTIYGTASPHAPVLYNKAVITGIAVSISQLLYYHLLKKETSLNIFRWLSVATCKKVLIVGMVLLSLLIGILEIQYQFQYYYPDSGIVYIYLQLWIFGYIILLFFFLRRVNISFPPVLWLIIPSLAVLFYLFWTPVNYDTFTEMLAGRISFYLFMAYWPGVICLFLLIGLTIKFIWKNNLSFPLLAKPFTWLVSMVAVTLFSIELQYLFVGITLTDFNDLVYEENLYSKAGLSIVWGLASFILIWLGMKYKYKTLRIVALVLFGATLCKLFTYDIRNIPPGGKIAAFILLGVVLLIVSFMYQRLKKILIDDTANKK